MNKVILVIEGMSCSACSAHIEKYLKKQPGIIDASVNLVLAQALITYDDSLTIDDLNRFIKESGYKSLGEYKENNEVKHNSKKNLLIIFGILSIIVLYISMAHMLNFPVISLINMEKHPVNYAVVLLMLCIPYLIYGKCIFKSGFNSLIHKSPNMDTLVSIGVIASFLYSFYNTIMIILGNTTYVSNLYFESVCIVIYFVKLGRFIDDNSKEKTKDAIKELVTITPQKAVIIKDNKEVEVTIDEVQKGDLLICKPGEKIAVDGIIVKGISHFDESFITGESIPSKKSTNDSVVAGSINIDGVVEYKAEKIGPNSTISEIVRLVVEATNTKAPISRIADVICGIFVPIIILIAILTFLFYLLLGYPLNTSLIHFVTVLVVACPCALGLATPLCMVISVGVCAKEGILVKNNETLENVGKIDTIVFDKTGTLTNGNLNISKMYNYSELSDSVLLQIIGSIESLSTHPIAHPFIKNLQDQNIAFLEVSKFKNLEGIGLQGVIDNKTYYIGNNKLFKKLNINNKYTLDEENLSKEGNSIVYLIEDNKVLCLIGVKDTLKDNAKLVIDNLIKNDINVMMLTGDNKECAKVVAKELGIKTVYSSLMPKDKVNIIKELINNKKKVMMVGDGINDAPSLAISLVGVSIKSGTDIANNSSNVILTNDNLENILKLIKISKKTITVVKENLFWAFFYNICMIIIAVGLIPNISINPMIAAFAMMLSSISVILNSLRLRRIK